MQPASRFCALPGASYPSDSIPSYGRAAVPAFPLLLSVPHCPALHSVWQSFIFPCRLIDRGRDTPLLIIAEGKLPAEAVRHSPLIQIFFSGFFSFFFRWRCLIFCVQLMAHHRIQFLFQPSPDFISTRTIFHQMIPEQRHKQIIRYLHIFHFISFLSASVCVDSDGIFYTAPLSEIPSQPTHIVAFYSFRSSRFKIILLSCPRLLS